MDDENNRARRRYDDEDEEEFEMKSEQYDDEDKLMMQSAASKPLAQANTNYNVVAQAGQPGQNMMNGGANALMNSNLEFECNACEKKFKYYCYYKRHMDACHSECPKYVCDTCNKSYKWEASFRQHLRSHHGINMTGADGTPGSVDTNTMLQQQQFQHMQQQAQAQAQQQMQHLAAQQGLKAGLKVDFSLMIWYSHFFDTSLFVISYFLKSNMFLFFWNESNLGLLNSILLANFKNKNKNKILDNFTRWIERFWGFLNLNLNWYSVKYSKKYLKNNGHFYDFSQRSAYFWKYHLNILEIFMYITLFWSKRFLN